ncbi:GA-like domain-containing protein, partial [Gallibacterium anatis]|uniref:GA-like domain-containing protein n=1 Tax=Gallibacterium anatis TaxID=750 RepID=UPI0039FD754A
AAEAKANEAQAKKEAIERDGAVNAQEKAELDALNQEVETLKQKAQDAIDQLPTVQEKGGLQGRVDAIQPVE